jgi:hypothetical protein
MVRSAPLMLVPGRLARGTHASKPLAKPERPRIATRASHPLARPAPETAGSAAYAVGEALDWRVGLAQRFGRAPCRRCVCFAGLSEPD